MTYDAMRPTDLRNADETTRENWRSWKMQQMLKGKTGLARIKAKRHARAVIKRALGQD